jgi:hypothetical protein
MISMFSSTTRHMDELKLNIGLDSGSVLRTMIDPVIGTIGASRTRRFLGAQPVAVSLRTLDGYL